MPLYDCPECGAQLKMANAPAPGKKIRCPKCEEVFAPVSAKKASKAAPAPAPAKDRNEELEEAGGYGVIRDTEDVDAAGRDTFAPLRERFERSARGPALVEVVKPSTILLASGVLTCVMAVVGGLYSVWPMIFKVELVQPEDKMAKWRAPSADANQRRFKELTDEERNERFIYLGGFVFQFLWGMVVCAGASNMHTLNAYPLAMTAAIMSAIGPGVPFGVGLMQYALKENDTMFIPISIILMAVPGLIVAPWCFTVLRKKEVIAGFAAEKPEDY
ncbi:MAG: hypothetical protein U0746_17610 [Gemmataceae bacterium]